MRIWQHFSASGPFKTNPQLLLKKNEWHTVKKLIREGLKLYSRRCNGFKECIRENTTHSATNLQRRELFRLLVSISMAYDASDLRFSQLY
jgi:hypothetical protein